MARRFAEAAGAERRPAAAGVGRLRHGPAGPAPGRQAAGGAQLDDRPGQPGPRRPAHGADPRRHLARASSTAPASTSKGREYLFLEDAAQGHRQVGAAADAADGALAAQAGVRSRVPTVSPDQPAVVLFTSGSEKAPKAVPLTHATSSATSASGIAVPRLTREDSILGFLPAFHSFGMTVTGLLPLLSGMRVVHHPDPTDAAGLARKIAAYKPTMLVGTPTFVSYILDRAKPGDLDSLRMIIVGAEKCPPAAVRALRRAGARSARCWRATASPSVRRSCRSTARRRRARHGRQAAAGVEVLRRRSGHRAAGCRPNQHGHAAGQRADGVSRLHRLRRPVAVPRARRQALVRHRRPGRDRRRRLHPLLAAG